jgi:WD40 repeat protein
VTFEPGPAIVPLFAACSAAGDRLTLVGHDTSWQLWDVRAGRALSWRPGGPNLLFTAAAASPDGALLAVGEQKSGATTRTGRVVIWDTATKEEKSSVPLLALDRGLAFAATGGPVAFSPSGRRLAVSGADGTLVVLDTETGEELFRRHEDLRGPVAFSPDGRRLALADARGVTRLWDVESWEEVETLRGEGVRVYDLAFSPDGARLASCNERGTIALWDPASGLSALTIEAGQGMTSPSSRLVFSADGNRLLLFGGTGNVTVWDATPVR